MITCLIPVSNSARPLQSQKIHGSYPINSRFNPPIKPNLNLLSLINFPLDPSLIFLKKSLNPFVFFPFIDV